MNKYLFTSPSLIIIIYSTVFMVIFTTILLIFILWILFSHHKISGKKTKAVNMSLFFVKSIDDFIQESDLMDIFKNMHLKGWNRFLYGDPYISLEKITQSGKTEYYVAIPKKYEQILSQNPHLSKIEKSILPENKHYASLYLERNQPLVKFGESKLHEEEGIALQILARHTHKGLTHFESNVRVLSWADSGERAKKILGLKKIKKRVNKRIVFDFFLRIFENNKRLKLSFKKLKNFLINKFSFN